MVSRLGSVRGYIGSLTLDALWRRTLIYARTHSKPKRIGTAILWISADFHTVRLFTTLNTTTSFWGRERVRGRPEGPRQYRQGPAHVIGRHDRVGLGVP